MLKIMGLTLALAAVAGCSVPLQKSIFFREAGEYPTDYVRLVSQQPLVTSPTLKKGLFFSPIRVVARQISDPTLVKVLMGSAIMREAWGICVKHQVEGQIEPLFSFFTIRDATNIIPEMANGPESALAYCRHPARNYRLLEAV